MSNQAVQVESIRVEEVGIQAELVLQEETKKDFKCEECGIRVSYAKSLKRHIWDSHGEKPKMYLKNVKIGGKFIC